MNEVIINNWNSVVEDEDWVFHVGDFAFGRGSNSRITEIVERLKGHICLIKGNHDRQTRNWYLTHGFDQVEGGEYYIYDKVKGILLSHRPYPIKTPLINIHGHIHNLMHIAEVGTFHCVSVEQTNYFPVDLDELIAKLRGEHEI